MLSKPDTLTFRRYLFYSAFIKVLLQDKIAVSMKMLYILMK